MATEHHHCAEPCTGKRKDQFKIWKTPCFSAQGRDLHYLQPE